MELDNKKIDEFIKKVQGNKQNELDLSSDEDLSIAIMNLISIEEHFFFTGAKTEKPGYFDLLSQAREMRKELLKRIIKDPEGEVWCISKHLLSASMRLMEVGTKAQGQGKKQEAHGQDGGAVDAGLPVMKIEPHIIYEKNATPSAETGKKTGGKGILPKGLEEQSCGPVG